MTYWLLLLAIIGNRLVSSVYNVCFYNLHIQFIYIVITRCWFIYFRQLLNSSLAWLIRLGRLKPWSSTFMQLLGIQYTIHGSRQSRPETMTPGRFNLYQCNQVLSIGGRDHQKPHGTDSPRRSIYQA